MNKTLIVAGIGISSLAAGCATGDRAGERRIYAGAGALVSRLAPDTDAVQGVEVDEPISGGGNVLLGYDLGSRFSLEGNYASLGQATLDPDGEIDYAVAGISALFYGLSAVEKRRRREGLSGFGRLGVGKLDNESDVAYEQVNDFNVLVGLGLEYGFTNGLGLRGEVVAHDVDVAYGQLALVYRFGDAGSGRRPARRPAAQAPKAKPEPRPSATPLPVPTKPSATRPDTPRPALDEDRDGIADTLDNCLDTAPGLPVDDTGCNLYDGAIDGIVFESGSDRLTDSAKRVLDDIAGTLRGAPGTRVAIEAHTDNSGSAESNLQLSRRRAIAVAAHLVNAGVAGERLVPRAFGESRPSVPNTSAEGRAKNRRVELRFEP